jgi:OOP family OmpA-OmpF porin
MKKSLIALFGALLFALPLSIAQHQKAPNALNIRASFSNFAFPYSQDPFADDYTFGLEIGYTRSINRFMNVAIPAEIGLARFPVSETVFKNPPELMGNIDLQLQFKYFEPDQLLAPYLFGGVGSLIEDAETLHFVFPAGAGLNVKVWDNTYLNLQAEYRYAPLSDLRDHLQIGAGMTLLLGGEASKKERSKKDRNTNPTPEKRDTDGDGILDQDDACPDLPGTAAMMGCPDQDEDGVADNLDKCPDVAGPVAGCPDSDGDGVANIDDACPDQAGSKEMMGCPDSDGDGVTDAQDQCPEVAGTAAAQGCPDRDGDGIADGKDACPDQAGEATAMGCPDSDKDGVVDSEDRCPNTPGVTANGCPEITSEDRETLDFAMKNVGFETGSNVLLSESNSVLDRIVEIMNRYPDFSLRINGHTDSIGGRSENQELSEIRAKACYDYLLAKGVSADRMSYKGYGESQPIANNKYKEGREKNRRVEFDLYLE